MHIVTNDSVFSFFSRLANDNDHDDQSTVQMHLRLRLLVALVPLAGLVGPLGVLEEHL